MAVTQQQEFGTGIAPSRSKVLLSTTSVYPESTASCFELAAELGYDGVELMVGIDPVAADVDYVEKLRDYHEIDVASVHAPTLLVTQATWGNAMAKLERSAEVAARLGADVVVVHPPFRWQREYGRAFIEGIGRITEESGIIFALENMYPWRTPAGLFQAYYPSWDVGTLDYPYLTLDLSHAATAKQNSRELARDWGERLKHVHLTDGSGSMKDEHLMPGEGNQQAWELLDDLRAANFTGHIVLEVNSRRADNRYAREAMLGKCLIDIRHRLGQGVSDKTEHAVEEAQAIASANPPDLD